MIINKKVTFIMLFIFAVGLCSGAFFEIYMEGSGKTQLMDIISSLVSCSPSGSFFSIFWNSFRTWLIMLLIVFVVPYVPPFAAICPFLPMIKGLTLGFSATMLVETFGIKGSWYIISTILPQNLLQIPILCMLIGLSMSKTTKKTLHSDARLYLTYYGGGALLIFISCLLEAFLMQFSL